VYPEDAAEPNEWFRDSVFDRAGIGDIDDPRVAFLDTQYRMQKPIGDLVSDAFYGGRLKSEAEPAPELPGFPGRVLFCDSGGTVEEAAGRTMVRSERRYNPVHAEAAARVVRLALESGVEGGDLGVIVPYNAQVMAVRRCMDGECRGHAAAAARVRVSTIHSFQGSERRVAIVDFTDSNVAPGPLTADPKLVNVALSRAREYLVMAGNSRYLIEDPRLGDAREMFRKIISRTEPFCP
jgi:superfamily I DNA and/or RNA helicase